MRKFWLVAKHEYLKTIRRRAFWLGTLGVPLLIIVVMAASIAVAVGGGDERPLGYVDHAGILTAGVYPDVGEGNEFTEMRAFPDEAAATAVLESGEIQAFCVVPAMCNGASWRALTSLSARLMVAAKPAVRISSTCSCPLLPACFSCSRL